MDSFTDLLDQASRQMSDGGKRVWSILNEIDANMVDMTRTRTMVHSDPRFISVKLFSKDDNCCPTEVIIGLGSADGSVYLSYDDGGAILDEEVSTDSEVESIRTAIRNHLLAHVAEESTFVKGELVRVRHTYTYPVDGRTIRFPFLTILKFSWPWRAKVVETRSYKPWPLRQLET